MRATTFQFRVSGATLAAIVLALACRHDDRRKPEPVQSGRYSQLGVIAWLGSDRVVFRRVDKYGSGDALETTCDSAGLYIADVTGHISPWSTGERLCSVLRASDDVSLSGDRRELLYAVKDGGGALHRFDIQNQTDHEVVVGCADVRTPVWMPTGKRIAFTGACSGSKGFTLYLVNADGSGGRAIGAAANGQDKSYPTWSADGRALAVQQGQLSSSASIVVVDTATGEQHRIASGVLPAWNPTDDVVAYLDVDSTSMAEPSLHLVRVDGSGDRRIFRDSIPPALSRHGGRWLTGPPIWSADGQWLAFANQSGVWIVNVNGTNLHAIVGQSSAIP